MIKGLRKENLDEENTRGRNWIEAEERKGYRAKEKLEVEAARACFETTEG